MIPFEEKNALIRKLEEAGAKVHNIPDHPDGKGHSLYVLDPDDNIWEIWSAP